MSLVHRIAVLGVASTFAVACTLQSHDDDYAGFSDNTPPPSSSPSTNAKPLLVIIDTDRTMNATPGAGVGVFTEYAAGGKWHVWWTCDTNVTNETCDFDVKISVASGAFSDLSVDGTSGATPTTTPTSIELQTTTAATIDGLYFDTDPSAIITLDAALGGVEDGKLLFFVQDGEPNGGFTGELTDPIEYQGSTP
jgi:hypothetical protein